MEESDQEYQNLADQMLDSLHEYPEEVEQEPILRNKKVIRFFWDQIFERTEILGPQLSLEQRLYKTWESVWFKYFGYGQPFVLLPPPEPTNTQTSDASLQGHPELSNLPPPDSRRAKYSIIAREINNQVTSIIEGIWVEVHDYYGLEEKGLAEKRGLLRKLRFLWRCGFEYIALECPEYSIEWKIWMSSRTLWENCFQGKPFLKEEPSQSPKSSKLHTKIAALTTTVMFGPNDWCSPGIDQLPPRIVKSLVQWIAQAKGECLSEASTQAPSKLAHHVAKYGHLQGNEQIINLLFPVMDMEQLQYEVQTSFEEGEVKESNGIPDNTLTMAEGKQRRPCQNPKRPFDETETPPYQSKPLQTTNQFTVNNGHKRRRTRDLRTPELNHNQISPFNLTTPPAHIPPPPGIRTAQTYKNSIVFKPNTSSESTLTSSSSTSPPPKLDDPSPRTATKPGHKFTTANWVSQGIESHTMEDEAMEDEGDDGDDEMDLDESEEKTPTTQVVANPFSSPVATPIETPAEKAQRELREEYAKAEAAFWVDLEDSLGK